MSEFSQDDLNAFFKGKLENVDPDGNTWNVPPDFVFDNAMHKVNAQNQSHKTNNKKLFLLLLIPFAILIGLNIYSHIGLDNINDKVQSLETKLISSTTQIAQLENELVLQKNSLKQQFKTQMTEINEAIKNESKSLVKSKIELDADIKLPSDVREFKGINDNLNKKTKNIKKSKLTGSHTEINITDQFLLSKPDVFEKTKSINQGVFFKKQKLDKPVDLPNLNLNKPFDLKKRELNSVILTLVGVDFIKDKNDLSDDVIRYGIFTRQNYSSLNMSGMQSGIDLTSYDNGYSGFGISLIAQKSISPQFDMQFSIGYDVINNRSQLSGVSLYDKSNEVVLADGSISYSMNVEIETPFGAVNSPTNFAIDANVTTDQEPMNYSTKTTQSLNVISLNVGPKYKWLETMQWEVFSSASLGYNKILHYESEMTSSIKMDNKTMVEFRATPPKINDINKNFLSAQVGLGFGFKFSENVQLSMSANYGRSLNSLRVERTVADPVTYLSQWNSQIGLNFSF